MGCPSELKRMRTHSSEGDGLGGRVRADKGLGRLSACGPPVNLDWRGKDKAWDVHGMQRWDDGMMG